MRLPIKMKNGDALIFGIGGNIISIVPEKRKSTGIYAATLQLGYNRNWNEEWATQFFLLPRLAASKSGMKTDDLQIGGLVLNTKKVTDDFKFRFGAYYNSEFFGNFFVPVFGFDWKPDSTWQIYGNLPLNTTVLCKAKPKLHFGFQFTGIITSYFLNAENHYLQRSTNDLCLFADIWLGKHLVLQPKAGFALGRSYREYDENDQIDFAISLVKFGDDRVQLNHNILDSPVAQFSLIYRVKVE